MADNKKHNNIDRMAYEADPASLRDWVWGLNVIEASEEGKDGDQHETNDANILDQPSAILNPDKLQQSVKQKKKKSSVSGAWNLYANLTSLLPTLRVKE